MVTTDRLQLDEADFRVTAQRDQGSGRAVEVSRRVPAGFGGACGARGETHLLLRNDLHLSERRALRAQRTQRVEGGGLAGAAGAQVQDTIGVAVGNCLQRRVYERRGLAQPCRRFADEPGAVAVRAKGGDRERTLPDAIARERECRRFQRCIALAPPAVQFRAPCHVRGAGRGKERLQFRGAAILIVMRARSRIQMQVVQPQAQLPPTAGQREHVAVQLQLRPVHVAEVRMQPAQIAARAFDFHQTGQRRGFIDHVDAAAHLEHVGFVHVFRGDRYFALPGPAGRQLPLRGDALLTEHRAIVVKVHVARAMHLFGKAARGDPHCGHPGAVFCGHPGAAIHTRAGVALRCQFSNAGSVPAGTTIRATHASLPWSRRKPSQSRCSADN